ncbi:sugar ABC transporter substrate-binding protein, partial [Streptomyces sp. NPDC089733]
TEPGYAQPLLWTARSQTAYQDALSRIITEGADPEAQIKAVVATANAELKRVRS